MSIVQSMVGVHCQQLHITYSWQHYLQPTCTPFILLLQFSEHQINRYTWSSSEVYSTQSMISSILNAQGLPMLFPSSHFINLNKDQIRQSQNIHCSYISNQNFTRNSPTNLAQDRTQYMVFFCNVHVSNMQSQQETIRVWLLLLSRHNLHISRRKGTTIEKGQLNLTYQKSMTAIQMHLKKTEGRQGTKYYCIERQIEAIRI